MTTSVSQAVQTMQPVAVEVKKTLTTESSVKKFFNSIGTTAKKISDFVLDIFKKIYDAFAKVLTKGTDWVRGKFHQNDHKPAPAVLVPCAVTKPIETPVAVTPVAKTIETPVPVAPVMIEPAAKKEEIKVEAALVQPTPVEISDEEGPEVIEPSKHWYSSNAAMGAVALLAIVGLAVSYQRGYMGSLYGKVLGLIKH